MYAFLGCYLAIQPPLKSLPGMCDVTSFSPCTDSSHELRDLQHFMSEQIDLHAFKAITMVAGSGLFSLISQVFLTYFFIISLKISHFPTISQLFPNYFSFPGDASHFSVTLPNYFSVISRLFPSESPDIFAIYNWLVSALTSRRLLHGVTVKSE